MARYKIEEYYKDGKKAEYIMDAGRELTGGCLMEIMQAIAKNHTKNVPKKKQPVSIWARVWGTEAHIVGFEL